MTNICPPVKPCSATTPFDLPRYAREIFPCRVPGNFGDGRSSSTAHNAVRLRLLSASSWALVYTVLIITSSGEPLMHRRSFLTSSLAAAATTAMPLPLLAAETRTRINSDIAAITLDGGEVTLP